MQCQNKWKKNPKESIEALLYMKKEIKVCTKILPVDTSKELENQYFKLC
jgi:hypothetical protein